MFGIGARLPLSVDATDGHFALVKTLFDEIRQNLFHLLMTSPGERIMDIDFGVGMRNFLFEQMLPQTEGIIRDRIESQVKKYLPYVLINHILFQSDEALNVLGVEISFQVPNLNQEDRIMLDFT